MFAGEYAFAHDGWPGVLTLRVSSGRNLRGSYRDHRLDQTFAVTGQVDVAVRHRVELLIHDFNWLPEQRFTGYLSTRDGMLLAGTTLWENDPFGFVALRARELPPPVPGQATNDVAPADFAGRYTLLHEGAEASVDLEHVDGGVLAGTCRGDGWELGVHGEIDATTAHGLTLRFTGDESVADVRAHGHLFTRQKNAISGEIRNGDTVTGFGLFREG
ncbi:hypothetical protein amrb99_35580 [Actinomadura sp. RB99]|uniref:hypothetical protein n=1 Tax=Actinomadura sp. RB99 TaxID=2691577 RepID=UPI00168881D9|nr:hypothetical protein [Actinomadura sp. RB99]MBD2894632.1 hypothetical protein [Actinomadura sp. RB99]